MILSKTQQQAMEAKLNFMLGAEEYDRLFMGFACGPVFDGTVIVFVESEDRAVTINSEYTWHIAVIVESILKRPVKCVNVLPKNFSDSQIR